MEIVCKERRRYASSKASQTIMKCFLHAFALAWGHLGLWVGYMNADYNYDPYGLWNSCYYGWDKGLSVLIILCAVYPVKFYKWSWLCFCLFMVIRLVWQVWAVQDYATASRPSIIFILFCINCVCVTVTVIYQLIRWQKKR